MSETPRLRIVPLETETETQLIAGQGTFNLLAVEELFKAVATGAPSAKFGIAFSEGSDGRILRASGNSDSFIEIATRFGRDINAGHFFIIVMENAFPLQVLNNVKSLSTTVNVQVASGNPIQAIVADLVDVSVVLGFSDGLGPLKNENAVSIEQRRRLVRNIGYLE